MVDRKVYLAEVSGYEFNKVVGAYSTFEKAKKNSIEGVKASRSEMCRRSKKGHVITYWYKTANVHIFEVDKPATKESIESVTVWSAAEDGDAGKYTGTFCEDCRHLKEE